MIQQEREVFKVTKSFGVGKTVLVISNSDRSIVYNTEASPDLLDLFEPHEYQIHVLGFYDNRDNNIYLINRVPDPE